MEREERTDFRGLRAAFVNCSLERDPSDSHTQTLMEHAIAIMAGRGVEIDRIHARAHEIAFGMRPDMTEEGAPRDAWPALYARIQAADILVLGTPIWLGQISSVCALVLERLYARSSERNDRGQYAYYGKVGGCLVTGNEDGIKACARHVLYALQHIGYCVPPQADAGWIGEAGPGPSYGDPADGGDAVPTGFDNEFTNRNTTFLSYNLMHLARMLAERGGFPAGGNQPGAWEEGQRFGHPLDARGRPSGTRRGSSV